MKNGWTQKISELEKKVETLERENEQLVKACQLAISALNIDYENGQGTVDADAASLAFGNLRTALYAVYVRQIEGKEVNPNAT